LPQGNYKSFQGLAQDLPLNVHLLSLQTVNETQGLVLLRLQHIFEVDEHPVWSQPASVDLDSLFASFSVRTVTEMNLTGDQVKSQMHKLHWNTVNKKV
jgi:lysosomal alpha-mannosidase